MSALEIEKCLIDLEDTSIYNHKTRVQSFENLKSIFDDNASVTPEQVQRTFSVLVNCVKSDVKLVPYAIAAVKSLLTSVKSVPKLNYTQDYMPSAISLLNVIKTICIQPDMDNLRYMSLDLLLSYPVEVLAAIVEYNCSDILEIFERFTGQKEDKFLADTCYFLNRLLKILPPESKMALLKHGLDTWFQYLIPTLIKTVKCFATQDDFVYLECLELLTENLIVLDYRNNVHWIEILKCICKTNGEYLSVIKNLLQTGSAKWYRLWIVVIKLLKDQITFTVEKCGIPINSMLPIVEMAFKMDVQNRCYAFQCWEVLIENFSKDPVDSGSSKRLKLLLIPLKAGNAKTETIAMAKFNCWWHLITIFDLKLDKYTSEVLLSFIQFAFGRSDASMKPAIAGAVHQFDNVKSKCVEAFVNIVGHTNCHCKSTLPRLKSKIMTSKLLVMHWSEWMYALKVVITVTADVTVSDHSKMPVLCAWKYITTMLSDLPNNGIRRDLFNGLLEMMTVLIQNCNKEETIILHLPDILISLLLTLFQDEKVMDLLTSDIEDLPIKKVLMIVFDVQMNQFYSRFKAEDLIAMFKPMTKLIVLKHKILIPRSNDVTLLEWFINNISHNAKISVMLWTALAESLTEYDMDIKHNLHEKFLKWPLNELQKYKENKYAANSWYNYYIVVGKKWNKTIKNTIDADIIKSINNSNLDNTIYFNLYVTVALLKDRLSSENGAVLSPARLLRDLISRIHDYKEYAKAIPMLVDTIVLMVQNVQKPNKKDIGKLALESIEYLLKIVLQASPAQVDKVGIIIDAEMLIIITNIFEVLNKILQIQLCSETHINNFIENLKKLLLTIKGSPLYYLMIKKIKEPLLSDKVVDQIKNCIKSAIDSLEGNETTESGHVTKITPEVFSVPESKKVGKGTKKKDANIVNTVVENGEEYVVVKSNWKFNPKKLTENQKEKLQRKREDIPALYQDLSQSQDEFKMSSWKTDSQDTTSSNSKSSLSTNNNDAPSNLNTVPSSDVIPTIVKSILTNNEKPHTDKPIIKKSKDTEADTGKQLSQSTLKQSPRLALKDRVFRNMRNLIENSKTSSKSDLTEKSEIECQVPVPKTPTDKIKIDKHHVSSAPPLLPADRPTRMRRIPKKFNDVQLFGLKKRRMSANDTSSESMDKDIFNFMNASKVTVTDTNISEKEELTKAVDINPQIIDPNKDITIIEKQNDNKTESVVLDTQNIDNAEINTTIKTKPDSKNLLPEQVVEDTPKQQDTNDAVNTLNNEKSYTDLIANNAHNENNNKPEQNENELEKVNTPVKNTKENNPKSSTKKSTSKKSRIEKHLAIDMVEGHPFLTVNSSERLTRKRKAKKTDSEVKTGNEKLNKTKNTPKSNKKVKDAKKSPPDNNLRTNVTVAETQDKSNLFLSSLMDDNPPCSEDIIESSQDSTFTAISVMSTKRTPKRVASQKLEPSKLTSINNNTQDLLQDSDCQIISQVSQSVNQESKDDIVLPQNKTAVVDKNQSELTENMDTEPIENKTISEKINLVNTSEQPIILDSEQIVGPETQELAEADTQPNNPSDFEEFLCTDTCVGKLDPPNNSSKETDDNRNREDDTQDVDANVSGNASCDNAEVSSSFTDEAQRKQDFLNNTSELSPIKVQSPDKGKSSPLQETSNDYVVVKLSSPVQSNGEPFEKSGSPEFFTEDKISPEKRDQSPPRAEVTVNSGSPTSVLSLKKNRPQVRPSGRAAQMLGLCVPDSLNTMKNLERFESDDTKKTITSTPVRRNLRALYNVANEVNDNSAETEDSENFLNFKKSLPSSDCSPSVPILKRKLAEITDDVTASPATKRKRVSFHDPPVSTTVSVQKYIEPKLLRSPQNSAQKRMTRSYGKSPKRLENAFVKLDTVLCKAVESFVEEQMTCLTSDTNNSLDITPAVEVVKNSELNDTDPICPELVDCKDSIENIALELSSPAMKDLFIKEVEGKVGTVGDLAKMTELEVNRLCIKAPKVQIAKRVLKDYVRKSKKQEVQQEKIMDTETMGLLTDETALSKEMDEVMSEPELKTSCIETQTEKPSEVYTACTQTDIASVSSASAQTVESGFKSISDLITSCISERKDFVDCLSERLEESSIKQIAEKLSTQAYIDMLATKIDDNSAKLLINKILDRHTEDVPSTERNNKEIAFIRDYLSEKFDCRSLVLLCSQLLQKAYDKPA